MPDILIVILAVIFVLGVAINIHEFGHFMVAKFFGMRVEAYSFFGLGPRVWGFKKGHTDYRISAIPLGAYVKLYGDEVTAPLEGGASDEEKVPESELYELRPRWQKFLVMIGGPFMNIVLALAIPFFGAIFYGVPSMPAPIVGFVSAAGAAEQAGVKAGDRIVVFDGVENPTWQRIEHDSLVMPEKEIPITVERGEKRLELKIKPSKVERNGNVAGSLDLQPDGEAEPVIVGVVSPDMPAGKVLETGDRVLAFNETSVRNIVSLRALIGETKGEPFKLTIERGGERKIVDINAVMSDGEYRIGIRFEAAKIDTREKVGVGQAAGFAVNTNVEMIRLTGKVLGQLFSGQRSVKDAGLAGPVGIVQIISQVVRDAGFVGLISILAIISLNLGIFNLLPIPLLDGGQIMVLGIEKVMSWFGKTLSMAIREKIQFAGLAIILLLMVFTLFLDVSRFF